jgi:hypothetical protein
MPVGHDDMAGVQHGCTWELAILVALYRDRSIPGGEVRTSGLIK